MSHITPDQVSSILWYGSIFLFACMGVCAGIAAGLPQPRTDIPYSKAKGFNEKVLTSRIYFHWYRMINAIGGNWGMAKNFADPKQMAILNMLIRTGVSMFMAAKSASTGTSDSSDHPVTVSHEDSDIPVVTHIDRKTKEPVLSIPTTPPTPTPVDTADEHH